MTAMTRGRSTADDRWLFVLLAKTKSLLNSKQQTTTGFVLPGDPNEVWPSKAMLFSGVGFASAVNVVSDIGSILLPKFAERATLTKYIQKIKASGTVLRVHLILI
jgi:hypothetical protein